MRADDRLRPAGAWLAFAGMLPLFIAASDLASGLALAGAFLTAHSAGAAIALFLPGKRTATMFPISLLGAAAAMALYASVIRIADPFLFERVFPKLFLVAFLAPVLRACFPPAGEADRGRGWENVARGLGLSALVATTGLVRELLASGAVSLTGDSAPGAGSLLPLASHPAGAFLLLAFAAAAAKSATDAIRRKDR